MILGGGMNKKFWCFVLVLVGLVLMVGSDSAFAYGEAIESATKNLLNWITKVLGGLAVGFGIVWTGIRVSMGDENAFKNGLKVIGGGILIFSAMNIVNLLQAIFK